MTMKFIDKLKDLFTDEEEVVETKETSYFYAK